MGRLTNAELLKFVREGKSIAISDGDGLTFTLSPNGVASWILRYRFAGRPRELTLGRYPLLSLADARLEAQQAQALKRQGIDPGTEKKRQQQKAFAAQTLAQLFDDFIARRSDLRPATVRSHRYSFEKDVRAQLGGRLVASIEPLDVTRLVRDVASRSNSSARRLWENLQSWFKHGVSIGVLRASPMDGLRVSGVLGTKLRAKRRNHLDLQGVSTLCAQLNRLGEVNRLVILILLATCVRKSELLEAMWSEIDLEGGVWHIPAQRTGNKAARPYMVPLAAPVVGWFSELRALAGSSDMVLPRQTGGVGTGRHMSRSTLNVALRRLEVGAQLSPHDLRATARSLLRMIGAPDDVIERSLNRSLGGMRDPYQDDLMAERRHYLGIWAELILEALRGRALESELVPSIHRNRLRSLASSTVPRTVEIDAINYSFAD